MAHRSRVIPGRRAMQVVFLALVVMIGVQFAVWAFAHMAGDAPPAARPAGVEGFLPISALMSARLWLAGGGVHPVHPAALAILIAALAMSVAVGKSFCSHLCPVGTVSELLGRLGCRLLGRPWQIPRWLDVPLRGLKYLLLLFFVWATWAAMPLAGVRSFLDSPYNTVADVKLLLFFAHPTRLTLAVLGILVTGSVLVRDLWCRYLCPYGALLGMVGRLSPLKVTRDGETCTGCRACTRACPSRLPVHTVHRVASVECTSCQDCVAACPVEGCLAVRPPHRSGRRTPGRPTWVALAALIVYLAVIAAFRLTGHWHTTVPEGEYARRVREISSPLYTHAGGLAPQGVSPVRPLGVLSHRAE